MDSASTCFSSFDFPFGGFGPPVFFPSETITDQHGIKNISYNACCDPPSVALSA